MSSFEHMRERIFFLVIAVVFLTFSISPAFALCQWKIYKPSNKTIYIQDPILACSPIAELQLIENTDVCLTNCHATIRVKVNYDIMLPNFENNGYKWNFKNGKVQNYKVMLGENVCTTINDYTTNCSYTNYTSENGTIITIPNCTQVLSGSHQECKIEYRDFWGSTLKKGVDYYIRIEATKNVKENVEWIPTFYTINLNEWAWWNTSWQFRRQINITSTSGNLTSYQVAINLTYDSDMQADFSDIRFTYYNLTSNTETEIPYWIESKVNSAWAYVWVKVPFLQNATYGNNTIYVYYGNTTPISSASNGDNVFINFADFEDGTIEGFSVAYETETSSTFTNSLLDGNRVGNLTDLSTSGARRWDKNLILQTDSWITDFKLRIGVYSFSSIGDIILVGNSAGARAIIRAENSTHLRFYVWDGSAYNAKNYFLPDIGNWHDFTFKFNGTTVEGFRDGLSLGSHTVDIDLNVSQILATAGTVSYYIDNIKVRKYTSPEPTISIGAEETNILLEIIITSPQNQTYYVNNVMLNYTVRGSLSSYDCWHKIDNNNFVYDGNIPNGTYYNTSLLNLSSQLHSINVTCQVGTNNRSNVTYFTITTGLNLSVKDYYTGTYLSNWQVNYTNQTNSGTLSCSGYFCILDSSIISGITTLNVGKDGYKTNTTSYNIPITQLNNYTVLLIIYDKFWLKDTISNSYLQSWVMNMTDGTILKQYSTTGYYIQIAHDELLRGNVDIRAKKLGYTDNTTTIIVNDTSYFNLTLLTQSVSLSVICFDERNYTQLNFNIDITNGTQSVSATNVSSYSNYISLLPTGNVEILISDPTNVHVQRKYFVPNLSNTTVNLKTYLLAHDFGNIYQFFVKKSPENIVVPDVLIKTKKSINATYTTIEEEKTDFSGSFTMFLDPTTQYQFELIYQGTSTFYDMRPVSGYVFWIGDVSQMTGTWAIHMGSVAGNCNYNSTTKILTCDVVDTSGAVLNASFKVESTGVINTTYCSETILTNSYTFTCNLSNKNGTAFYSLVGEKYSIQKMISQGYIDLGGITGIFSNLDATSKIFVALTLIVVMAGIGMFSPAIGLITMSSGIIISVMLGLLSLGMGAIVGILVIIAIAIYLMRE